MEKNPSVDLIATSEECATHHFENFQLVVEHRCDEKVAEKRLRRLIKNCQFLWIELSSWERQTFTNFKLNFSFSVFVCRTFILFVPRSKEIPKTLESYQLQSCKSVSNF